MRILVFNVGSSSVKFGIFDMDAADSRIFKGEFEGFKEGIATLHYRVGGEAGENCTRQETVADVQEAVARVPALLAEFGYRQVEAVGHRVAHGGEHFTHATVIDEAVIAAIESCIPLAPLHNPAHLYTIQIARTLWKDVPHIAVFDTAFHHSNPAYATSYAVPTAWREAGLRRYGFHGTSHKYVGLRVAEALGCAMTDLKIISCHVGNGASICAIEHGFSVDSSMGMTPLEGLVMGTRSGDVDPGIFGFLQRTLGLSIPEIEQALYTQSGLKALAGTHDMREIEALATTGDAQAQLAITLSAYRVRKYIGAYAAAMGGVDVIAFTGGIGEHSATMRRRICEQGAFLGIVLDEDKNQAVQLQGMEVVPVHHANARVKIMVTQASEQWMIAKEAQDLLSI